jgi:WD40 repeat protein
VEGKPALVSAGAEGIVRLWSPDDGRPLVSLAGHTGAVTGVCTMPYAGREIVVSTGLDRTVRLWDPATGQALRTIPVHHPALSCVHVGGTLVVGLDQGLLALAINA